MLNADKRNVNIACAQIDVVYGDINRTVSKVCDWVDEAADAGADVVLFPELVLSAGYALGERFRTIAESISGASIKAVAERAKHNKIHVIVGLAEKSTSGPYDSAVLIDRDGRVVGTYRKSHTYPPTESIFTLGKELPIYETDFGTIGLLICYDLEFPETARILTLQGAEIIFHLAADWPQGVPGLPESIFDLSFRTRALENRIIIATCNRVGNDPDLKSRFYGLSRIIGTSGEILAGADDGDKMILASVNLEQARRERGSYNYIADRHPELYRRLSEPQKRILL